MRQLTPTEKQLRYLESLIVKNNQYRAKPRTLNDWVDIIYKGSFDMFRAKYLIQTLKEENQKYRSEFRNQTFENKSKDTRTSLLASDISQYYYCPKAFEFVLKHKTSTNVYELSLGKAYHGEVITLDKRLGVPHKNDNEIYLKSIKDFVKVEWIKTSDEKQLYCKEFNIAGVPDGVITYKDGTQSIVEIKTNNKILDKPYIGEIIQTVAYNFIFKDKFNLNNKAILLYIFKNTGKRYHFDLNVEEYISTFRKTITTMNNILRGKYIAYKAQNKMKCKFCGFSEYCR